MNTKIIFFLIAFFSITLAVLSLEDNPHNFHQSDCTICHRMDSLGTVVATDINRLTIACTSCHANLFDNGYIHPIDIKPENIPIATGLPLSATGMITCNTCHDIHAPHRDPSGANTYFLRRNVKGKAFCDLCHSLSRGAADGHQKLMTEAHLGARFNNSGPGDLLDPLSKNCISCHDGSVGPSVSVRTGSSRPSSRLLSHFDGGHPIGVDYEDARFGRGRKTNLRPLMQVDKRLKFFNGKIGCGTCHNPFKGKGNRLVMSNYRSQLCFACHAIDG